MTGTTDPRTRQLGDERARYGRKGAREQLDDALEWPGSHRIATAVLVAFLTVGGILWATRGTALDPADLRVGDCLFVRTSASQDVDHPIGTADEVASVLLDGGAERASCDGSHGHEVAAVLPLNTLADPLTDAPARCTAAFEAYVGRPSGGSIYVTFPAIPAASDSSKPIVCLVARADGSWMDHPARGSGR